MSASFEGLPYLLKEIAELTNLDTAFEIARAKGGTRAYIPMKVSLEHWLYKAAGMDMAHILCQHFGGSRLDIPLWHFSVQAQARQKLCEALTKGASASEAAKASGLHERTVWRKKAQMRNDHQLFMFDKKA